MYVTVNRVKWELKVKSVILWIVSFLFCSASHIWINGYIESGVQTVDEADRKLGTVHLCAACCTTAASFMLTTQTSHVALTAACNVHRLN